MATLIRPPLITKFELRPRHAAIDSSPQQSRLTNLLVGKDTFFDGAGRAPVYDWPNPVGHDVRSRAWPSILLRTWTDSYKLTLIGKDLLPRNEFDWPISIGYDPKSRAQPSILLKTWTDNTKINLIGKDRLPVLQKDWPVPNGPRFPIDLRTWTETTTYLLGKDRFFGLAGNPNFDWPVPKGPVPVIDLKTWTENLTYIIGKDQLPELNYDWPNPRGKVPSIDLKTWTESTVYLIGQDRFFGLAGHPNFDWPNPRGPIPAIVLKTWLDNIVRLIGKDQLPARLLDWANPRGAQFPPSLLSPLQIDLLNTLLSLALPFNQLGWPNPRGAQPGQMWTAPTNPNLLPPTPVSTDQLKQIIRFAPLAWGGRTHWTR